MRRALVVPALLALACGGVSIAPIASLANAAVLSEFEPEPQAETLEDPQPVSPEKGPGEGPGTGPAEEPAEKPTEDLGEGPSADDCPPAADLDEAPVQQPESPEAPEIPAAPTVDVPAEAGEAAVEQTIGLAPEQAKDTMERRVRFVLEAAEDVDLTRVDAQSFAVNVGVQEGEGCPSAIDRVDPRVVSLTRLPVVDGRRRVEIAVEVNDSAQLSLSTAKGTALLGGTSSPWVTFTNPLRIAAPQLPLIIGHPVGNSMTAELREGAPVPTDDIRLSAHAGPQTPQVALAEVVLAKGGLATPPVMMRAPTGAVAGLAVALYRTQSTDPLYDALWVPAPCVRLANEAPAVKIEVAAYVGMTDSSSGAGIVATGRLAVEGTAHVAGEPVCFVYTVTNVSQGEGASALVDLRVRDTANLASDGGLIGTIPRLEVGEQQAVSACIEAHSAESL